MRLLSVCGSPRKGNTEWMLTELNRLAEAEGIKSKIVLLRLLDVRPCTGCLTCEKGGADRKGVCMIKDSMTGLYAKMLEADVLVFGTPVFFEMLSGQLKTFMDRTCPIWPKLKGKGCAGIAVAEGGIGQAIENIRTYASPCGMKWLGSVTTLAKTPHQAAGNPYLSGDLATLVKKIKDKK
ncbi:MAG: flavodoxin family protein [Dehalococcoidia bacterium]|nr:flavodoxin family protein [Dehalococcoidia bacterium]